GRRVVKKRKWVKTASLKSGKQRSSAGKTVKVRRGDTLWKVSRKYGLTVDQLCRWNGLKERSILHPGQVLSLSAQ
ncbi:MAG: LysM peptidoglycan-binding domain-containing protein, partial [Deltaproteobacteria bacterium]|nr:LysM peptidoglycan-binding domain-containing protein [Candidatus Tharpellaceae bacterium]